MTQTAGYDILFAVRFYDDVERWRDLGVYDTYDDAYAFYVECEELGRFKKGISELVRREIPRNNPERVIDRSLMQRIWN